MKSLFATPLLIGVVSASLAFTASAQPSSDHTSKGGQCFYSEQYQGFHAINDHSFYIRVNLHDYYRIDLSGSCPQLQYPDAFLITRVRGSNLICGPLDWDLRVSEPGPGSIAIPCIVTAQTKLSKEEAAAIPPKLRP